MIAGIWQGNFRHSSMAELVKLAVSDGLIPRYVYKYRSINENTKSILSNARLWFSKPSDFNDPFDCQLVVQANNSEHDIATFLRKNAPSMSSKDVKKYSRHWSKNLPKWRNLINQTINEHINNAGICCFAGNCENILMWSHYSEAHKGICLKFDILADPEFFSIPLKVKYDTEYPKYDHVKDSSNLVQHLIMTKSECWKYEEELRVLKDHFGPVHFQKETLSEVIFGCNCPPNSIAEIKEILSDNFYPNIRLKKARTSKDSFKLEIGDLKQ
ncbi:MAG: DUF2971 domain-containing protein [Chitinophagaceae bacterium]|nr:MAG: DUF2971 domain-containing protein [Chitinophagaceae bacterium]